MENWDCYKFFSKINELIQHQPFRIYKHKSEDVSLEIFNFNIQKLKDINIQHHIKISLYIISSIIPFKINKEFEVILLYFIENYFKIYFDFDNVKYSNNIKNSETIYHSYIGSFIKYKQYIEFHRILHILSTFFLIMCDIYIKTDSLNIGLLFKSIPLCQKIDLMNKNKKIIATRNKNKTFYEIIKLYKNEMDDIKNNNNFILSFCNLIELYYLYHDIYLDYEFYNIFESINHDEIHHEYEEIIFPFIYDEKNKKNYYTPFRFLSSDNYNELILMLIEKYEMFNIKEDKLKHFIIQIDNK
jgi:hypothetical protein